MKYIRPHLAVERSLGSGYTFRMLRDDEWKIRESRWRCARDGQIRPSAVRSWWVL